MTAFAIIGFGEVGGVFARDLRAAGAGWIVTYDIEPAARSRARNDGFDVAADAAAACAKAGIVFLCVTAGSTLVAAASLEKGLSHRPYVVDVNSVSPATKQHAAEIVTAAGGRYVEAAVMTSVPPKGLRAPILLGGEHVRPFMDLMTPFGMDLKRHSDRIGGASSVKMCRSVMIKGIEALVTECMLSARHYGVEQDVLRSLADTLPHEDWPALARYMMSRALLHGRRRAEEMREVARTVEDAGLEPLLSRAIAERQDWAAATGRALSSQDFAASDLGMLLDTVWQAQRAAHEGLEAAAAAKLTFPLKE
jgi:3-hydroxyisobutyrate dehydrogenase-like beta-hydroxyacid dehydrogenase